MIMNNESLDYNEYNQDNDNQQIIKTPNDLDGWSNTKSGITMAETSIAQIREVWKEKGEA